jgi:hypothetical protein
MSSTPHIPYPRNFDQNLDEERLDARRQLALRAIDAGDVIAVVEDMLASEPDPRRHPLYAVAAWYLDKGPHTEARYWAHESFVAAWETLVRQAIDALVEAQLQDPRAWED